MNPSHPDSATGTARECWATALQLAAQEVFELMLACPLAIPPTTPSEEGLDLTAMVGLAGLWSGLITMRCSRHAAARMASRIIGIETTKTSPEMLDAVGEICNMVAGNCKNKISGLGDACMLSVPTVITGADYNFHPLSTEEFRTVMRFEEQTVVFTLEIHT